ncbi:MAG: hypothetical protein PHQ90_09670, partial [Sulfuricurvum sp.]|nr:hypothetical protein [Sulfuricurvum sp.]
AKGSYDDVESDENGRFGCFSLLRDKAVDLSIPVSDLLIDVKFGGSKAKVLSELECVVTSATREGLFVCIGGEDSSRGSHEFIKEVMELARECGAS